MLMPSVTEVISPWNDFSNIPAKTLETAADRGTAVHEICANISRGLFVASIPGELKGYVDSFSRWFDKIVENVLLTETRLVDSAWGYHGQIDLLVQAKHGEVLLTDLKTPAALKKQWRVQMSAYDHLVEIEAVKEGFNVDRVGSLRLHPEGKTAKMEWYENSTQDFHLFTQMLNIHRFFKS